MATVQSLGLGSGLDIDGIITALVDAEKVPQETQLNTREAEITAQVSAFGTIKSKVSAIESAVATLSSASTFNSYTATSSDTSVFTATPNALAESGTYNIEVENQAQGHTLASPAYTSVNDTVGTGTLTIKFGSSVFDAGSNMWTPPFVEDGTTSEATITVDSTNNTVASLRDYINAGSYGITASIVNDGSGYRLLLTSETGAKNSMEITVDDDDTVDTDASGLSNFAFNFNARNATQTLAAADANLVINGLTVTSTTNTLTEAIPGVTLNLTGADDDNPKTLTVEQNKGSVKEDIQALVDAYNDFNDTVQEVTAYVAPGSADNGVLLGDVTVRSIQSQIRATMLSQVTGLTGSVTALADLGILSNQNTGKLEITESTLDEAIANSFNDIRDYFVPNGAPSDSLISYVSSTGDTQAGTYAINVTQMATQGTLTGGDLGGTDVIITAGTNDTLTMRIDGFSTETLTLAADTYTGAELATELQTQINNDANMAEQGLSATVSYDSVNDKLVVTSNSFGSNSTVAVTSENDSIGFDLDTLTTEIVTTTGVNVAGTINGSSATGSGQFLTSAAGNSLDLRVSIIGGSTGDRGNIVFTRGIADQLDSLLEQMTDDDGTIDSKTDGLNTSLIDITESREQLTLRMDQLESRLLAQFTAMDTLVSQLNSVGGFLTQTLANLPGARSSSS